jgi:hypothetical protein
VTEAPPSPIPPQPAAAVVAADRPRCHETTDGVVIMRGTSCSREAQ